MTRSPVPSQAISVADTAKWVAMYRAEESERPDALFRDPYARRLAGERGAHILERMPRGRTFAWPMVVRTAVIDELITQAVRRNGFDFVVNMAAGLDARPYRMDLPPALRWVEVDYPATIDEKAAALANETPRCKLERIGADLADVAARRELFKRLSAEGEKGLVVTEGLMVYLTREQAGEFAADLAAAPSFRSWVTDIAAPFVLKIMQRTWSRGFVDPTVFRFAPEEGAEFYARFGWRLAEYRSTLLESRRLKRESPMAWIWSLLYPRAIKQEATRRSGPMTGTILLTREG